MLAVCTLIAIPFIGITQTPPEELNKYQDINGKKQGYWCKRDQVGNKIFEGTFKNDVPVGEFKRFHSNGAIKHRMNYNPKNPLEVSVEMFNEQGILIASGKFYNQEKQGVWQYFENKQLIAEDTYNKGKLDGTSTIYWQTTQNQQAAEIKNWTMGEKNGAWLWFYENGQLRMNANYMHNKLDGPFIVYYSNGSLMLSGTYKNDSRDGEWKYINEDGSTKAVLQYTMGKMLNEDEFEREQTRQIDKKLKDIPDFAEPDMKDPALLDDEPNAVQTFDPNDPQNYHNSPEEFIMRDLAPNDNTIDQQAAPSNKKQKNATKIN
jgi:antitoxin component YwqK of YwqJK toxin-antitoxin module